MAGVALLSQECRGGPGAGGGGWDELVRTENERPALAWLARACRGSCLVSGCVCGYALGQAGAQGERVTIGGARPAQEVRGAPGRSGGSCHWVHSLKPAAARG